jgi:hypothetical protein
LSDALADIVNAAVVYSERLAVTDAEFASAKALSNQINTIATSGAMDVGRKEAIAGDRLIIITKMALAMSLACAEYASAEARADGRIR